VTTLTVMAGLQSQGLRVAGMKPVASGCRWISGGPVNDDAALIRAACSMEVDYDRINPWALMDPIAPHISAERAGMEISLAPVIAAFAALSQEADAVVVEGVGGWRVPLSASLGMPDLAAALALPVILVVGLKLGCLNHALLSAEAVVRDGCRLAGWIANHVDEDYDTRIETVQYLSRAIHAPLLGEISYIRHGPDPVRAAAALDLSALT
jgi:dethiobiotin synthetase